MKKGKKRLLTILFGAMLLLGNFSRTEYMTFASEADRVPDLSGERGSLQVGINYTDSEEELIPIADASFKITKAADLNVIDGNAKYSWLEPFADCGFEIAGMSIGTSIQAASALEDLILKDGIQVETYTGETDDKGLSGQITDLSEGIYLIYDFNHPDTKDGMAFISPYLIQVPGLDPANANAWVYQVLSYPKPDVVEIKPNQEEEDGEGSIQVTKQVTFFDENQEQLVLAEGATFYVGLFLDEEGTQLYEPGGIKSIDLDMESSNTVMFENLPVNRYYVFETLEDGTPIFPNQPYKDQNGCDYICELEDGQTQEVVIAPFGKGQNGEVVITNRFLDFPANYSFVGKIDIEKNVVVNGEKTTVENVFYAGIYTARGDGSYELYKVVPLEQNGSVRVDVPRGSPNDMGDHEYWIYECDEDGDPVRNDPGFKYTVSGEGSVLLNMEKETDSISITNEVKEEAIVGPVGDDSDDHNQGSSGGGYSSSNGIKTGDDTVFLPYILAMLVAVGAAIAVLYFKKKK